jgi:DNA relaxase NicK
MICCIDWLTFTIEKSILWQTILQGCPVSEVKGLLEAGSIKIICEFLLPGINFGDDGWQYGPGRYFFKHRMSYQGVEVIYGGSEVNNQDDVVCINISGQGCRTFENINGSFDGILEYAYKSAKNITRIDLAVDDREGQLDIDKLYNMSAMRVMKDGTDNIKCRWWGTFKCVSRTQGDSGTTIYFGSESSKIRVRIYDKAKEQGIEGHWIRTEVVLRDEKAREGIGYINETGQAGEVFASILSNSLLFCHARPRSLRELMRLSSHKNMWFAGGRIFWNKLNRSSFLDRQRILEHGKG